jgi:DNA helicase-2/ATP-dependent DNA helicase PcrA
LLEQNYRSTQNILSAANAVIAQNPYRPAKNLWTDSGSGERISLFTAFDERNEAAFVVDAIKTAHEQGANYRDMAVLYRTNALTLSLENELKAQRVPYIVVGGLKFFERKEIKDALSYLAAIANVSDDEAIRRIINTPARGIGEKTEAKIAQFARKNELSLRQALLRVGELGLGPKITTAVEQFGRLLNELDALSATEGPADVLKQALIRSGYRTELELSRDPQDEARIENLDALLGQLYDWQKDFPQGSVVDYLAEITLASAQDEMEDESGNLSLMTLHTAKGLEFDSVFIIGCEQGTLPHIRAFDEPGGLHEERRLMYVGMTRARKKLHLSHALQRTLFGNTSNFLPSSFLSDIPADLVEQQGQQRSVSAAPVRKWQGTLTTTSIRDNQDLQLAVGDRISHESFGEGSVFSVSGEGPKQVAEVRFDDGHTKRLLTKMAPITRL